MLIFLGETANQQVEDEHQWLNPESISGAPLDSWELTLSDPALR